jgi:zinc transporter, ZIP family
VIEAFLWGALGASALIVGALVAYLGTPSRAFIAIVMALGTGLLIGSVSFELIDEAVKVADVGWVGIYTLIGAAAFTVGDWWLTRRGGGERKDADGAQADGSALAIVLGSVLDGIPESFVLGLTVLEAGSVSAAFLVAVFLSNLPEAIAATTGLTKSGWSSARTLGLWVVVTVVSGLAALAGYVLLDTASPKTIAVVLAFAGGAILTMLADTMMPEAFEHGGRLVGLFTTLGFGLAFLISSLE